MCRFVFLTLLTLVASTTQAAVHAGALAPAKDAAPADTPEPLGKPADSPAAALPDDVPADAPQPPEQPQPEPVFRAVITADVWDGVSARTVHSGCASLLTMDDDGRIGPDVPAWARARFSRVESERIRADLRRAWCLSLLPHAPPSA